MTETPDRAADAQRRVSLEAGARHAEASEAQRLIDGFVAEAGRRGLAPVPLRAQTYSGGTVKTDRTGWYLNRAHSLAIGDDGSYLRLIVPASTFARWTGVKLSPEPPPLAVGRGGRDGQGGDLRDFLARVLEEGGV